MLGEFWKEADGDQLLLRPGEETIWYYAHEQDKVKRLCNDMTELLEKNPAPDKATQQMAWVQHMNSLKAQAEELVMTELIYS